ncbi:MAG: spermidine/putrescine ABC transporter substrate-binding protein, partial [Clostridia bacterium]
IARNEGLLLELDKSKLPNYVNIDPVFQNQYYDPDNKYTIPYAAGTPLIIYDPALVDIEITGYEDLWNPALADSVVVMNDARNVIGITLKTLGASVNTTDPAILAQAREKLLQLKPNIRALDYDTPHQLMISGETAVGYMFTPQIAWTLAERPDLKVVYPKEGMGYGIDSIVVPAHAPHANNAHQFINFLLQPEIGAKIAQVQQYMNCNQAAVPLLESDLKTNNVIYIPGEIRGEAEFIKDVGDALPIYDEIWTAFKQQ